MKNREENIRSAISGLKLLLHDFETKATPRAPYRAMRYSLSAGIQALEKQTPKKPEIKGDFMEGAMKCPECGHHLGRNKWRDEVGYLVKHCRECGQALDWSE